MIRACKYTVLALFIVLLSAAGLFGRTFAVNTAADLIALNTGDCEIGSDDVVDFAAGKTFDVSGEVWEGILCNKGTVRGNGATVIVGGFQKQFLQEIDRICWGFVLQNEGRIENLRFALKSDISVSPEDSGVVCGSVVCAYNKESGVISGCHVSGSDNDDRHTIKHYCLFFGAITGFNYGSVDGCSVSSLIVETGLSEAQHGLITGSVYKGSVTNSFACDSRILEGLHSGGIAGYSTTARIANCAVWRSDVQTKQDESYAGGIAGSAMDTRIKYSCVYYTNLQGDTCGGAAGWFFLSNLSNCYTYLHSCYGYICHGLLLGDAYDSEGSGAFVTKKEEAVGNSDNSEIAVTGLSKAQFTDGTLLVALTSSGTGISMWYEGPDGFPLPEGIALNVPVAGVSLDRHSVTLEKGKTLQLNAAVEPADATDKGLVWSSYDKTVAKVSSSGKVTAVGPGSTTIRVKTKDGGFIDKCKVKVTEPVIAVTGVTLDKSTAKVEKGKTITLKAAVAPAGATDQTVTWSSYDKTIATVDSAGKVKGVAPGSTTIRVKTKDGGFTAKCKVTVTQAAVAVTGVTLNKTVASVAKGKTITLKATVAPADATNQAVTWSSSDTAIATVDSAGKVKGVAPGTATIKVKTKDGGFTAKCKVTVTQAAV
ncbi:MAG: Ig domain-containing protein, partial [Abditibacteriota bacterium]|nr:Ig domain-containing protein [Abditibacteriota bacterium]